MNSKNPKSPVGPGFRLAGFPKEFERSFLESFDKRYYTILLATFLVLYGLAFYFAFQDWTLSDAQLEAMKKRIIGRVYDVQLIVDDTPQDQNVIGIPTDVSEQDDQPVEEVSEKGRERVEESQATRQQRRRGTQQDAARRSREMQQSVANQGILAIATGAGGGGSGLPAYENVLEGLGGGGVSDIGAVVSSTSGIRPSAGGGERTTRGGRGSGQRDDGDGTGIDDMISGGTVGGGGNFERRGSVDLAAENLNITSGSGSRNAESITAAINRQKRSVEYCYQKSARTNPNLRGRIDLELSIAPTGAVTRANVLSSTLGDAELERCITRSVRRWKFDKGASGPVSVRVPFIF